MELNKKFEHIMLDIETLSNQSYAAILSIAAVQFDLKTGEIGETFYRNIELQSCLDIGLEIKADTLDWWLEQSAEARDRLRTNTVSIKEALIDLASFIQPHQKIWGNSARFDCGIIENAYYKLKLPTPWDFWRERDVRTLVSFAPEIKKSTKFEGVKHDAIDDCKHQIKYCVETFNILKNES